jgi:hypothetical protein
MIGCIAIAILLAVCLGSGGARHRECDLCRLRSPRPSPANSAGCRTASARSSAMINARHDMKSHEEELDEDIWVSGESALCYYQKKEGKHDRPHYSYSK